MPTSSVAVDDGFFTNRMHNEYRLLELLGEGGNGKVYKAHQINTGQTVAIKLMREKENGSPEQNQRMVARFEREAHLCAQLQHPHIVKLLDKGQAASQQLFAVFEYVPGETLKDMLIRKGPLSALEAGDLMGQVLDALACAHAQGIAHRDLKPQNLMITSTGTRMHVKVLDFGIATFISERQKNDFRHLTMTSEMMCSPSYSAPEHLRGEPPTLKMDLYAWGLLFIECLTGRPAIEGSSLADIFHQQLSSSEVPLPPALVGHPLADLLRRVLRKNPQERAGSASAIYADFQKINLANIVGDLSYFLNAPAANNSGNTITHSFSEITQEFNPGQLGLACERSQMTVLACTLNVHAQAQSDIDLDALEALQHDQLSLCTDTANRYGGHLAGALGNGLMFYFGYPHVAEDDARRCARTALELVSQVRRRNALLAAQGFRLDIRIGMHTGQTRIVQGHLPTGMTPNTALQLERAAAPGSVLVSHTSRKILGQHVEFEESAKVIEQFDGTALSVCKMVGEHKAEAVFLLRSGNLTHGMVGREPELAQLMDCWQRSTRHQGQALLLRGEAGIGKSRLAYEFCLGARQQGAITREVRCLPEYQNNALHPILSMLRSHWHLDEMATPLEAVQRVKNALTALGVSIESVLPILCSWLALPIPLEYPPLQFSPERQKNLLLDAMQDLILQIGQGDALLLLIEDMHWIDQTSAQLLDRLMQKIPAQRVMLLMTARPGFDNPWPGVGLLDLMRLNMAAAAQLVGRLIGGKRIDPQALQRLCERTDGVPLFMEELTRMLLDQRMLVERRGVYQLVAGFETADIPVTLRDLLGARLGRLGSAKDTAQLAAAIGREFDYALLAELSLCDEGILQTDLEQLIAADLIYRQRRVNGDSYIFRHALIRDAAWDAMPKKVREQTHARIAQQLAQGNPAEIERNQAQLAQHYAYACDFEHAVKWGTQAARMFLQRALSSDAMNMAERVQEWIGRLAPQAQRAATLANNQILTNAMMSKYGWADARVKDLVEHSLSLVAEVDDVQLSVPILWSLAFYYHTISQRKMARDMTDQLFALAQQSNDQGLQVACYTMRGVICVVDGDLVRASQALEQVLALYDIRHHADQGYILGLDPRVWATAQMGIVLWYTEPDESIAFAKSNEALAYARELNHMPSLGIALIYQAFLYQYRDDRVNAQAIAMEALALSAQYGLPEIEAFAVIVQAWASSDLATMEQVILGLTQAGCLLCMPAFGAMVAEVEERTGQLQAALTRLDRMILLCDEIDEQGFKPVLLLRRAIVRRQIVDQEQNSTIMDLRQAILLAEKTGMLRCGVHARALLLSYNIATD